MAQSEEQGFSWWETCGRLIATWAPGVVLFRRWARSARQRRRLARLQSAWAPHQQSPISFPAQLRGKVSECAPGVERTAEDCRGQVNSDSPGVIQFDSRLTFQMISRRSLLLAAAPALLPAATGKTEVSIRGDQFF